MTMHPDPHAPHTARRWDDESIYTPLHKRTAIVMLKPRPRRPSAWRVTLHVLTDIAALAFAAVGVLIVSVALLLVVGTDEQINAWGWWLRAIIGG